jgi:hypothetical protein
MTKKDRFYNTVYEHVVASAKRHVASGLISQIIDWCGGGGVATIANEAWNAIQDASDLRDIATEFGVSESVM